VATDGFDADGFEDDDADDVDALVCNVVKTMSDAATADVGAFAPFVIVPCGGNTAGGNADVVAAAIATGSDDAGFYGVVARYATCLITRDARRRVSHAPPPSSVSSFSSDEAAASPAVVTLLSVLADGVRRCPANQYLPAQLVNLLDLTVAMFSASFSLLFPLCLLFLLRICVCRSNPAHAASVSTLSHCAWAVTSAFVNAANAGADNGDDDVDDNSGSESGGDCDDFLLDDVTVSSFGRITGLVGHVGVHGGSGGSGGSSGGGGSGAGGLAMKAAAAVARGCAPRALLALTDLLQQCAHSLASLSSSSSTLLSSMRELEGACARAGRALLLAAAVLTSPSSSSSSSSSSASASPSSSGVPTYRIPAFAMNLSKRAAASSGGGYSGVGGGDGGDPVAATIAAAFTCAAALRAAVLPTTTVTTTTTMVITTTAAAALEVALAATLRLAQTYFLVDCRTQPPPATSAIDGGDVSTPRTVSYTASTRADNLLLAFGGSFDNIDGGVSDTNALPIVNSMIDFAVATLRAAGGGSGDDGDEHTNGGGGGGGDRLQIQRRRLRRLADASVGALETLVSLSNFRRFFARAFAHTPLATLWRDVTDVDGGDGGGVGGSLLSPSFDASVAARAMGALCLVIQDAASAAAAAALNSQLMAPLSARIDALTAEATALATLSSSPASAAAAAAAVSSWRRRLRRTLRLVCGCVRARSPLVSPLTIQWMHAHGRWHWLGLLIAPTPSPLPPSLSSSPSSSSSSLQSQLVCNRGVALALAALHFAAAAHLDAIGCGSGGHGGGGGQAQAFAQLCCGDVVDAFLARCAAIDGDGDGDGDGGGGGGVGGGGGDARAAQWRQLLQLITEFGARVGFDAHVLRALTTLTPHLSAALITYSGVANDFFVLLECVASIRPDALSAMSSPLRARLVDVCVAALNAPQPPVVALALSVLTSVCCYHLEKGPPTTQLRPSSSSETSNFAGEVVTTQHALLSFVASPALIATATATAARALIAATLADAAAFAAATSLFCAQRASPTAAPLVAAAFDSLFAGIVVVGGELCGGGGVDANERSRRVSIVDSANACRAFEARLLDFVAIVAVVAPTI
jgi:hypothetical protein